MSDFPLLLASEMGVTRRTVTRWCEAGKVPGAYRTKGGHWRLRKSRRLATCRRRYDDKIIEFVVRYSSVPGSPVSAGQARLLNKIMLWLDQNKLLAITASILGQLVRRPEENALPSIDWDFADEIEKLIDSKDFNNELEFSLVAGGISEDDKFPMGCERIPSQKRVSLIRQHFRDLKDRDLKKYDLLTQRDFAKVMHPLAYKAIATHDRILKIKAAKLKLNMRDVTPQNLARELKISLATLYRQYGREAVRRACRPAPEYDESPTSVRYQLS
jgi:hypothetical protein